MNFVNATPLQAGWNVGLEASGRELIVVVVKGTFRLPANGEVPSLHEQQVPLVMADTFSAEPGRSAPVHEIDFAPRKHRCDVLLVGHAQAPAGREVTRLRAGLSVGSMNKVFDVVGDRHWQAGLTGYSASPPRHFMRMRVSYDTAFGGTDSRDAEDRGPGTYGPNPVGRGWHGALKAAWVEGRPLPNTEEVGTPVRHPADTCRPMALGPLARGWPQRACFAGTYDQRWIDDVFPFLPADFDERYFQAAPADQRIAIPDAPVPVVLSGFTADGERRFMLPWIDTPVRIVPRRGESERHAGRLDSIVVEPDDERLTLTWRVTRPLRRSIFEIAAVQVGVPAREPAAGPALRAFA